MVKFLVSLYILTDSSYLGRLDARCVASRENLILIEASSHHASVVALASVTY
jgi:hypothetical protein